MDPWRSCRDHVILWSSQRHIACFQYAGVVKCKLLHKIFRGKVWGKKRLWWMVLMAFKCRSVTDAMSIYEHIKKRETSNGNLINISAFQRCEMKSVLQHNGKRTREWTDNRINRGTRSSGICFQIVSKAFGKPRLHSADAQHWPSVTANRKETFGTTYYSWVSCVPRRVQGLTEFHLIQSFILFANVLSKWLCLIFWFIREWKVREKKDELV